MSLSLVIAIVVTIILLVVFIGLIANMMTKGKKEEAETKPKKSALEQ
jgi:flagellar basal body-associated protein FliL